MVRDGSDPHNAARRFAQLSSKDMAGTPLWTMPLILMTIADKIFVFLRFSSLRRDFGILILRR